MRGISRLKPLFIMLAVMVFVGLAPMDAPAQLEALHGGPIDFSGVICPVCDWKAPELSEDKTDPDVWMGGRPIVKLHIPPHVLKALDRQEEELNDALASAPVSVSNIGGKSVFHPDLFLIKSGDDSGGEDSDKFISYGSFYKPWLAFEPLGRGTVTNIPALMLKDAKISFSPGAAFSMPSDVGKTGIKGSVTIARTGPFIVSTTEVDPESLPSSPQSDAVRGGSRITFNSNLLVSGGIAQADLVVGDDAPGGEADTASAVFIQMPLKVELGATVGGDVKINYGVEETGVIYLSDGTPITAWDMPADDEDFGIGVITPRISLTYDITGDGKSVVKRNADDTYTTPAKSGDKPAVSKGDEPDADTASATLLQDTLTDVGGDIKINYGVEETGVIYLSDGTPITALGSPPADEDSKLAFSPRLSFAWDLKGDGETIVRGGLGLFYNRQLATAGTKDPESPGVVYLSDGTPITTWGSPPADGDDAGTKAGMPTLELWDEDYKPRVYFISEFTMEVGILTWDPENPVVYVPGPKIRTKVPVEIDHKDLGEDKAATTGQEEPGVIHLSDGTPITAWTPGGKVESAGAGQIEVKFSGPMGVFIDSAGGERGEDQLIYFIWEDDGTIRVVDTIKMPDDFWGSEDNSERIKQRKKKESRTPNDEYYGNGDGKKKKKRSFRILGPIKIGGSDDEQSSGGSQWALHRVGFGPTGIEKEPSAWDIEDGRDNPVIVAVIDSGLDFMHPDFSLENLWVNTDEIPGNFHDDDHNGYVDDVVGWNFIDWNNAPFDDDGHGTVVAGIIAASTDNSTGIAGINWGAKVMVLKVSNSDGRTTAFDTAKAIIYAVNNGTKVINLSLGGGKATLIEQLAVDYALGRGVVVVAASGNEGMDIGDYSPASLRGVITVGGTDTDDKPVERYNFGDNVFIAAPSQRVFSLRARNTSTLGRHLLNMHSFGEERAYYIADGTSFAAPIVAGTVSLMLAEDPSLSNEQVAWALRSTAVDVGKKGWGPYTGFGRLDALGALGANTGEFIFSRLWKPAKGKDFLIIIGTADAASFESCRIEIGKGKSPGKWETLSESDRPVRRGIVGLVKAGELKKSSLWTIRITVSDKGGRTSQDELLINTKDYF